jgi:hypothetical protein
VAKLRPSGGSGVKASEVGVASSAAPLGVPVKGVSVASAAVRIRVGLGVMLGVGAFVGLTGLGVTVGFEVGDGADPVGSAAGVGDDVRGTTPMGASVVGQAGVAPAGAEETSPCAPACRTAGAAVHPLPTQRPSMQSTAAARESPFLTND